MTNIEQLKKETDEIKKWLDELKNNVSLSEVEKKNKAETLKAQVETAKKKIQREIHSLEGKTDDESKKEKEEAETLLNSFNETMKLYASILNNWNTWLETSAVVSSKVVKKEKWFFGKTWDWIWEQWDKAKENPWKYVLGATGLVAAWWAVKKVWNWISWDDDENKTENDEGFEIKSKKKKESFWKTGWGNFLKWTWITTAVWWWVYGISKLSWKKESKTEIIQEWWVEVSEAMFKQLLYMEGDQDFVAKSHGKKFWESFVTWPYGMVYKHIDENGNLLKNPVPFNNWEHVNKDWAEKNARAYYNKKAKEWSDLLRWKWYEYSQNMLDALVSASWWTKKSVDRLKNFVLSHWDDKDAIFDFMSKFATTAAWNWKTMPWLVIRRDFEANRFKWNKEPLSAYQKRHYQDRHYA